MSMHTDPLTIDSLLRESGLSGDQVNKKIENLTELAQCFDGVEDIIDHWQFGLKPAQETDVRDKKTTSDKVRLLLQIWSKKNPLKATYKTLLSILLDRQKGSTALHICEHLKRLSKTDSNEMPLGTLEATIKPPQQPTDSLDDHLPQQPLDNHPPQHSLDNHPPQQPLDNHTPQQPLDNHTPQQPLDNHPPQQPLDNHPPQQPPVNHPPRLPPIYYSFIIIPISVLVVAALVSVMLTSAPCAAYVLSKDLTMSNFEQLKEDHSMWYSPPVYTHPGGYRFCLGVTPNGELEGNGTHVTVAVFFMKGEFDHLLKWPFRGNITFQLVDQLHGVSHRDRLIAYNESVPEKHCSRVTEGDTAEWGWGPDQFIAHSKLEPRYLINDTLKFRITTVEVCPH